MGWAERTALGGRDRLCFSVSGGGGAREEGERGGGVCEWWLSEGVERESGNSQTEFGFARFFSRLPHFPFSHSVSTLFTYLLQSLYLTLACLATFPTSPTPTHFTHYLIYLSIISLSVEQGRKSLLLWYGVYYPTLLPPSSTVPPSLTVLCLCRFCCSLRLLFDPSFFFSFFPGWLRYTGYSTFPWLSIIPL